MSDLFTYAPQAAAPKLAPSPRQRFAIGDRVRPIADWRDGLSPEIPTGEVTQVAPFGMGQVLRIGSSLRWHVAGIFERDDG